MTNIQRYHAADLPELMDKITKNSIGLDDYFNDFFKLNTTSNYPPFNLVQLNNHESKLEVALAGFKKDEVKVYTEFGKLHVEGIKEEKETDAEYTHTGAWHNVHSSVLGNSAMIAKYDRSYLPMDSSPWI